MADRVHPHDSPSPTVSQIDSSDAAVAPKPSLPPDGKPVPPPGTYVIKIPKDQIYRVPPPENARRFAKYTDKKSKRSYGGGGRRRCSFCCCFSWFIGVLFIIALLIGIAAGVLYLVFKPKSPHYSIDHIGIKAMNLTTAVISPEFNITVKADNPNDKIGIRYETDSSAEIFFKGVKLCDGALPAFYQPPKNITVFMTPLKGNGIKLKSEDEKALVDAQTKRQVPLNVKLVAPVKIKVGSVESWKITVKIDCDVTVDQLTVQSKILSKKCNYKLDLWLFKI
ncbi:NDR1/HIN1-like protein 13 [Arachis duranensis]|uniref:NDR1/HIN1-like protein 13 n=1 Tax=Arachis duranensis TaxID=130453 RepID=A0A9C6T640_ARADU|nr:NDR1/HIN1-like protein 13 [Arachis duranensis]XP_057726021.1 NDR1/HIN1-like protein 13 [Arachis stenosperma]XP_057726022.1 NDR1/HIN1-like protein 13 [Arachis stenosperma]